MRNLFLGLVALMALTFVACDEETIPTLTYHINFDTNGGSYVECQEIENGQNAMEPTAPEKDNYTFINWTLNNEIFDFSSIIDSSITLVATWQIIESRYTYFAGFEMIKLNENGLYSNDSTSGSIYTDNLAVTCSWSTSQWGTFGSGFTISNHKDVTTAGYNNPYSCIAESGANNSETFAVCNGSSDSIKFNNAVDMESVMLCNNTYAYLSMRDGDSFAKNFGGIDGTDEDYYKLTVSLYDVNGDLIGDEDFYLADFRGDADYIVNEWTKLDLSIYQDVSYIKFGYESTDQGTYGYNTPAYFCIDNIAYYAAE